MGKKSKKPLKPTVAAGETEVGFPKAARKEMIDIVNLLLEKCTNPYGEKGQEFSQYLEIYGLVEQLRQKQKGFGLQHAAREKGFPVFMQWLNTNGVKTDAVEIEKFEGYGFGLKALRDIEASELLLSIPKKVMMTTDSAKSSVLGPLIKEDKILQNMSNVVLALHILCEKANPSSPWKPYINILPSSYTTSLYFSSDEVTMLKGSPVFVEVISQFRSIARQYAYFFKLFQRYDVYSSLKNLCFDDYRWAVSTVMTRQNLIPNKLGEQSVVSLIPLWDMCNHTNGYVTTDFDLKKNCSQCFALRNFRKDEQLFIFYGSRSNGELLVHNGFIFKDNDNDCLPIRLGISKNDHLYAMKCQVLSRLSLQPSQLFHLHTGQDPVDSETLAYLRVFVMDHDELKNRIMGENAKKLINNLRDFGVFVSIENEKKAWNFLETRAQLLLKSYPSTIQEDEDVLSGKAGQPLSQCGELILQLRLAEKIILHTTVQDSRRHREEVDFLIQQHLQQMSLGMNDLDLGTEQASITEIDDDDLGELLVKDEGADHNGNGLPQPSLPAIQSMSSAEAAESNPNTQPFSSTSGMPVQNAQSALPAVPEQNRQSAEPAILEQNGQSAVPAVLEQNGQSAVPAVLEPNGLSAEPSMKKLPPSEIQPVVSNLGESDAMNKIPAHQTESPLNGSQAAEGDKIDNMPHTEVELAEID